MNRGAIVIGLISMLAAVGIRWSVTSHAGLTESDLTRFESEFGLDLPDWYGDKPFFLYWTRGDGQAFVALAADPLGTEGPARSLGSPSYRFLRVGYAVAGRSVVGWQTDLVPVGMLAVNLVSVFAVGVLAASRQFAGRSESLLLLLNPALYIGVVGDTAEPLAVSLLAAAVLSTTSGKATSMAVALGVTRPSYLTGVVAARKPTPSLIGGALAFAITMVAGTLIFAEASSPAQTLFTLPGAGFIRSWHGMGLFGHLSLVGLLLLVSAAFLLARDRELATGLRLGLVSTAFLVLSVDTIVLSRAVNAWRAAGALPVVVAIAVAQRRTRDTG